MFVNGQRRKCSIHLWKLHSGADVSEVLIPPFIFINMGSQVRVYNTNVSVMKPEPNGYTSLVTLKNKCTINASKDKEH